VLDDRTPVEREVPTKEDEWFLVRHHPYRTVDERIDGIVITFVDITRRKTAEEDLREANRSLKNRSEQVQALSDALTSAEQTERRRISQILHDDLQQTTFAARMRIDHLREEASLDEDEGFGLMDVREWIQMIGGRLELESAPGEGTRVTSEVLWQGGEKATAYPPDRFS